MPSVGIPHDWKRLHSNMLMRWDPERAECFIGDRVAFYGLFHVSKWA